ncbi:1,4-beta-xylanase [Enterococcus sp. FDAARGOS_553]|uniref:glycoside hydrolase family 113 n=1 Tax=Enterococcus sp. FDAARGOS_553 TaxID=2420313 RepID=UPI000F50E8A8|nr:1,4-beta-xylanase [Enterococcus sp. FDAARGOS_553]AYY09258.1 1,4-beta-xylanase [Enterococcus sp. FDAARGOS_553]
METINGITFGFMSQRGDWQDPMSRESLRMMKEELAASHVILPITVTQAHPQSTKIDWQSDNVLIDAEVKGMIAYAQGIGLKVILKPMVNVADDTWRAHINFFDYDVPCEPTWSQWFDSYREYLNHYAKLAEETGCVMLVIGCELVNSDRREAQWRETISQIRQHYNGLLTYNCDKYQENNLTWWDAVDVISSSGYYPIDKWEQELDRIEQVVNHYQKPFFFCEVGCPSREGSQYLPNDWSFSGEVSMIAQSRWFEKMFTACDKRNWIQGFGIWDWKARLYSREMALKDDDYGVYGKPAAAIIREFYKSTKQYI